MPINKNSLGVVKELPAAFHLVFHFLEELKSHCIKFFFLFSLNFSFVSRFNFSFF